jgi:hypothetical protein
MQVWQRPEAPVAQQRTSKPMEEKESSRWLEGDQGACEVTQVCPATLGVNMADRAGDIQEWLVDARRRVPRRGMYGPRGRRPPWAPAPSHSPANRSGRPDRSPAR